MVKNQIVCDFNTRSVVDGIVEQARWPVPRPGSREVQQMLDFIQENYASHVTLDLLGARLGRRSSYLGALFRSHVGMTVHQHVIRLRLEHAAAEVRAGVKIEAVALAVGYRSKKNFFYQFKRRFGVTPEQYRRQRSPLEPMTVRCIQPRSATADCSRIRSDSTVTVLRALRMLRIARQDTRTAFHRSVRAQQMMLRGFTASRLPMLVTDELGRYVGANHAALARTGYSPAELRELGVGSLFFAANGLDPVPSWQITLPVSQMPGNAVLRRKNGSLLPVHLITIKNVLWGRPELSEILTT